MGGYEFSFGGQNWSLLLEGGYQWVDEWVHGPINVSTVRSYVGLGRNF